MKGGISETRIEKRIVITGDTEIDHDKVRKAYLMHTILFILKYGTISCSICSFTNVFIYYVKTKPINHSLSTLLFRLWPKPLKRLKSNTQTCLLQKLLYTRKQRLPQSKRWVYNLNRALLSHSTLNPFSGLLGIPNFLFRSYSFNTITAVIWSKAQGHRLKCRRSSTSQPRVWYCFCSAVIQSLLRPRWQMKSEKGDYDLFN